jgi:hypothetical protein
MLDGGRKEFYNLPRTCVIGAVGRAAALPEHWLRKPGAALKPGKPVLTAVERSAILPPVARRTGDEKEAFANRCLQKYWHRQGHRVIYSGVHRCGAPEGERTGWGSLTTKQWGQSKNELCGRERFSRTMSPAAGLGVRRGSRSFF